MIYGSSLLSCIQSPENFGVAFGVRLEALETQNTCTGWRDEMHKDHVTLFTTILFSSPTLEIAKTSVWSFLLFKSNTVSNFPAAIQLGREKNRGSIKSEQKISLSDCQVTTKSGFKPWDLSISLCSSLIAF